MILLCIRCYDIIQKIQCCLLISTKDGNPRLIFYTERVEGRFDRVMRIFEEVKKKTYIELFFYTHA